MTNCAQEAQSSRILGFIQYTKALMGLLGKLSLNVQHGIWDLTPGAQASAIGVLCVS